MKNGPGFLRRFLPWLPAIAAAPFAAAFLFVAMSRWSVPFELEWNEGQSAEQALRFARGEALYPAPGGDWVPYMYAPLYHMVLGAVFKIADPHLMWGRAISIASTIAAAAGIGWIVRDRSRDAAAAWFAALLFFAYFKPSGYWYDIARIDSFAFALTVWGMGLALSRAGRSWHVAAGLALLALATLAKQTAGPVAVFCGAVLLARRHPVLKWMVPVLALAALNFAILFARAGNDGFWHYVVRNALKHASDLSVLRSVNGEPPRIWAEGLCHVWLLGLVAVAWSTLQAAGALRTFPRSLRSSCREWSAPAHGLAMAICAALLVWGAVGGFAKFGGFRNNFLPMFGGVCLLAGLALADAFRTIRAETCGARLYAMHACILGMVLVQLISPIEWRDDAPLGIKSAGVFYDPRAQLPHPDSTVAHERLMKWLAVKHSDGEPVFVMHHQWYGVLAGHPHGPGVDMIRCATWAGDEVPQSMRDAIASGRWRWLVLDADPEWDWQAPGIKELIAQHYGPARPLPAIEGLHFLAMAPMTGAPVRPAVVLERR